MPKQATIDLDLELAEGSHFLVFDKGVEWGHEQVSALWNEQGLDWHVGVAESRILVVMGESEFSESVPVTMTVWTDPPEDYDADAWDHIVEVSLRSESGFVQIDGDQEDDIVVALPAAGSYRVRVSVANLDTAYDDEPADRYVLDLWPAEEEEPCMVKWWEPWIPAPPPPPRADCRTIYGIDNYHRALREMSLRQVAGREEDPAPELRPYVPASYQESFYLLQDKEGVYWEYCALPPDRKPLLTELTPEEVRERYGLDV